MRNQLNVMLAVMPGPPATEALSVTLMVQWPFRSIWRSPDPLPSTQTFDFVLTGSATGEVWRWSAGQVFAKQLTTVEVEGGSWLERGKAVIETRMLRPDRYTATGLFLATKQTAQATFELDAGGR